MYCWVYLPIMATTYSLRPTGCWLADGRKTQTFLVGSCGTIYQCNPKVPQLCETESEPLSTKKVYKLISDYQIKNCHLKSDQSD